MDRRTEIRDFLTSRRARITPEQAGLKVSPLAGARRVAGLRREEVALLAGVSVPYYTRLERGDARGAPPRRHRPRDARPGSRCARNCGTCWRR